MEVHRGKVTCPRLYSRKEESKDSNLGLWLQSPHFMCNNSLNHLWGGGLTRLLIAWGRSEISGFFVSLLSANPAIPMGII